MRSLVTSILLILCLLFAGVAYSTEPVPYDEFAKISNQVIDVIDEVDVVFARSESKKYEIKDALNKLELALKKYDRYVESWPQCDQLNVVWAFTATRLSYDIALAKGIYYGESHKEAILKAKEARKLFQEYIKKHQK